MTVTFTLGVLTLLCFWTAFFLLISMTMEKKAKKVFQYIQFIGKPVCHWSSHFGIYDQECFQWLESRFQTSPHSKLSLTKIWILVASNLEHQRKIDKASGGGAPTPICMWTEYKKKLFVIKGNACFAGQIETWWAYSVVCSGARHFIFTVLHSTQVYMSTGKHFQTNLFYLPLLALLSV